MTSAEGIVGNDSKTSFTVPHARAAFSDARGECDRICNSHNFRPTHVAFPFQSSEQISPSEYCQINVLAPQSARRVAPLRVEVFERDSR